MVETWRRRVYDEIKTIHHLLADELPEVGEAAKSSPTRMIY